MQVQRTAAAICCVLALAGVSVQAMQWARAYTDDGPLFYPGVTLTVKFWGASDMKVDTTKVTDGYPVQVQVNQYNFPSLLPGQQSDYCDGCILKPGVGQGNSITINGHNGASFDMNIKGQNNLAAFQYLTLVVTGSTASGYNATVIAPNPTRWYRANFWVGKNPPLPGAFHQYSHWMLGQDGDTDVDLFVPLPGANQLRTYQAYSPVYVNVSVADTKDGDDEDEMGYNNNGANSANPMYNTQYFVLAPFLYGIKIPNNQNLFSSGSIIQFTGAALDTQASYVCVFYNNRTGTSAVSQASNPTSSIDFSCTFPDALSQVSLNNDQIILTNITCVGTTDGRNWGYLPVSSAQGNTQPKWRYVYPLPPVPPGPDNGGTGLTGGQIFGIILAVFVGVGVIAYGGFYFYKKKVSGDGFYTQQNDTVDSNKPQQIQYNPSSYGSSAVDSSKAGGFQAADNI